MNQALLVIDAQQALIDGDAGEPGVGNKEILLQKINAVIEKAVQENVNIVFVRDTSVAGGEGPGFEVHPAIRRPEGAAFFKRARQALLSYIVIGLPQRTRHRASCDSRLSD
ncbi:isochorismatase [Sporolactobacillus inulinus]|uniref:Isochorismatase n=1 Tax=Sporolactobacillus inulinus TaxID=2078 RepID=A0A4Y1ZAU1_9BACL|nr:isochorismatase [Sporolactobacillus inulinus]